MSVDQARAFIEKMKSDEEFRDRIMAIEAVDARLAAASDAGFEFTEAEINEVKSELNDDELDRAAGGCPIVTADGGVNTHCAQVDGLRAEFLWETC